MRRLGPALAVLAALAPAPAASAELVGSELDAVEPTRTISCPRSEACVATQSLDGNGSPFAPPTGVIARWSVKVGAQAPEGIRLVVVRAHGTGGAGQERQLLAVGSLRHPDPNRTATFTERLPIHGDESFGVRLEGSGRAGTRASVVAPYRGEYDTMLLWDPPLPFGGPSRLADQRLTGVQIAISADVVPPDTRPCSPFNTYSGSSHGDDYGGFSDGGDSIYGFGGGDELRGYDLDDCMYGGKGADHIAGMDDDDTISGGPGRDDIGAGHGDDRILVRDGSTDTVRCGSGRDSVKADRLDRLFGCEQIARG